MWIVSVTRRVLPLAIAMIVAIAAMQRTARAEGEGAEVPAPKVAAPPAPKVAVAPAPASSSAPAPRVPDASLRAVKDHVIKLEVDGAPAVEGKLLAFEAVTVTVAASGSNQVVTVPRAKLARVFAVEAPSAAVSDADVERRIGVGFSLLGTVAVDIDYKRFHGFASTSLLLPIVTAAGEGTWFAAAFGGGITIPLGTTSRWKLDVFGQVTPLRTTSYYTYLGFGIGAGFHYTASSGFTLGFTMPVLGFATRLGSSPYGYDPAFRYNDSVGYYYLAGLAGMPIVTMGYRFPARR